LKRIMPGVAVALFLFALTSAAQESAITTVEAMGDGENAEAALAQAQRNAVELAVGVLVGGETLVGDYAMLSDRIVAHSSGYLHKWVLINQEELPGVGVRVTIRADVAPIVSELVKDRQALDLLLSWLNKPRVTIQMHEDLLGDSSSNVASKALAESFRDAGFTVIDPQSVETLSNVVPDTEDSVSAELLLTGQSSAHVGTTPAVMKRAGMVSVQASITASLVQLDTREVLATRMRRVASPHIDSTQAGRSALEEAASFVADSLISDVLTVWALQRANALPLEVVIRGVAPEMRSASEELIKEAPGVRRIFERSYENGNLEVIAEMVGTSSRLAEHAQTWSVDGHPLKIASLSWGRIVFEVVP
jgi:methylmalonyl-CoA mutase cobalamin-binding subunit